MPRNISVRKSVFALSSRTPARLLGASRCRGSLTCTSEGAPVSNHQGRAYQPSVIKRSRSLVSRPTTSTCVGTLNVAGIAIARARQGQLLRRRGAVSGVTCVGPLPAGQARAAAPRRHPARRLPQHLAAAAPRPGTPQAKLPSAPGSPRCARPPPTPGAPPAAGPAPGSRPDAAPPRLCFAEGCDRDTRRRLRELPTERRVHRETWRKYCAYIRGATRRAPPRPVQPRLQARRSSTSTHTEKHTYAHTYTHKHTYVHTHTLSLSASQLLPSTAAARPFKAGAGPAVRGAGQQRDDNNAPGGPPRPAPAIPPPPPHPPPNAPAPAGPEGGAAPAAGAGGGARAGAAAGGAAVARPGARGPAARLVRNTPGAEASRTA